jgi:hypothetical protein
MGLNLSARIAHRQRRGDGENPKPRRLIGARPDAKVLSTFADRAPVMLP